MKDLHLPEFTKGTWHVQRNRDQEAGLLLQGLDTRTNGIFWVRSPTDNSPLKVIVACGGGWDHVSISHRKRTPNWPEMEFVKRLFFKPDEVAMQLHVAVDDHINVHPYVLHLWRPHDAVIPLPPKIMV